MKPANSSVAAARSSRRAALRTPLLTALALTLTACGGAAQIMDGTPHAGSISPTVATPAGASTDYGASATAETRSSDAPLADIADGRGAAASDAAQTTEGRAGSESRPGAEMPDDPQVASAPGADPLSGTQASTLQERGFFGIAEPIGRAEQPSAAPAQPRQPTPEEVQARQRRDALASIVGQFDSPSGAARGAPQPGADSGDPRIADVPDRPDDAPTQAELAAMREQLESSRDQGRTASEDRTERMESEEFAPFDEDESESDGNDSTEDEAEIAGTDPAAMIGGMEAAESETTGTGTQEDEAQEEAAAAAPLASTVTIPFETGSTALTADARRMVTDLAGDPTLEGASIRVIGYATDADGGESTARDRATVVADALRAALSSQDVSGISVEVDADTGQGASADIRINE